MIIKKKLKIIGKIIAYGVIITNILVNFDILNTQKLTVCTGGDDDYKTKSEKIITGEEKVSKTLCYNVRNISGKSHFESLNKSKEALTTTEIPYKSDNTFQNFTFKENTDTIFPSGEPNTTTVFNFEPLPNKLTIKHIKTEVDQDQHSKEIITIWEEDNFLRRNEMYSQQKMGEYLRTKVDRVDSWAEDAQSSMYMRPEQSYASLSSNQGLLPGLGAYTPTGKTSLIPNLKKSTLISTRNSFGELPDISPVIPQVMTASPRLIEDSYTTEYEAQLKVEQRNSEIKQKSIAAEVDDTIIVPQQLTLAEAAYKQGKKIERLRIYDEMLQDENVAFYDQRVYTEQQGIDALKQNRTKSYRTIDVKIPIKTEEDAEKALANLPSVPKTIHYSDSAFRTSKNSSTFDSTKQILNSEINYNKNDSQHENMLTKEKPKKISLQLKTKLNNFLDNIKQKNDALKENLKKTKIQNFSNVENTHDPKTTPLLLEKTPYERIEFPEKKDIIVKSVSDDYNHLNINMPHDNSFEWRTCKVLSSNTVKQDKRILELPEIQATTIIDNNLKERINNINPFQSYFDNIEKISEEYKKKNEIFDQIKNELEDTSLSEIKDNLNNILESNKLIEKETDKLKEDAKRQFAIAEQRNVEINELKKKSNSLITFFTEKTTQIFNKIGSVVDYIRNKINTLVTIALVSAVAAIAIAIFIQLGGIGFTIKLSYNIIKNIITFPFKTIIWIFKHVLPSSKPNIETILKNVSKLLTPTKSVEIGKDINPFINGTLDLPKIPKDIIESLIKYLNK